MLIRTLAKLGHSSRNAFSAAVLIIAAIALYNWMVTPHAAYLYAARQYETAMGDIVNKNEAISDSVKAKREEVQELRERSARLESMLFTADKAVEFFSDLQVISEQAGCVVLSLGFPAAEPGSAGPRLQDTSGIVARTVLLAVAGPYKSIVKLMDRLQSRAEKVWIDSVNIQVIERSANTRCDITITIHAIEAREAVP
ncbi:MAG: hypothetical protein ACYTBJ_05240 [Planctomycetota bacterium]|jgi:hypothetical protein